MELYRPQGYPDLKLGTYTGVLQEGLRGAEKNREI